jgi:hypothetical protein
MSLPFYYNRIDGGVEFGPNYSVDTLGESLVFAAAAPFVLLLGLHLLRLLARGSGLATAWMLGGQPAAGAPGSPAPARYEDDAIEVVKWRGLSLSANVDPGVARLQSAQLRAFGWHLGLAGGLVLFLAVINIVAGGGFWVVWPLWALSIPVAVHAGYLLRGLIGAHAGLYAVIIAGLIAIDANYSDGMWFYWPAIGWGAFLAVTAVISSRLRRHSPQPSPMPDDRLSLDTTAPGPASAIEIDREMRRVTVEGGVVELTPKEFELLVLLYENPGRPFNRGELLDRIWKNDYEVTERTVDACVVRLRRKLGRRAEAVQTVWGVGYKYQAG